jgi:hypothetical protein
MTTPTTNETEARGGSCAPAPCSADSANPYEVLGWAISFCCSELDEGRDPRTIEMPVIMRAFEKAFSPPNDQTQQPHRA